MAETEVQDNTEGKEHKNERRKEFNLRKYIKGLAVVGIAFSLGYIHYHYVSHLFENDRNFSHLSELEREMSLRTEMGFYYSYYKTLVEEKAFINGISKLMYDKLVEFPKDVNAFNRFNIHPEVIAAAVYRYLEPYINTTTYRQCHMVDRGEGLAPVESCVGIGQPIYLYLETVWWLAGLTVTAIFLHATALSESILGGFLAVAQYFANHAECTRVQWAPNERENFAMPLLLLQTWLVSIQLRENTRRTTLQLQVSIFVLNCLCLLFWQFSQFIFLTQTAIFFVMEQLRIIDNKALCVFLHSHFCGLHMAVLLLQGNDMLKTSLYASFFLIVSAYCLFFSSIRVKVQNRFDLFVETWLVFLRLSIAILASFYLKKIISSFLNLDEDSHIWDILYSKFTNYKTFHTLIYTCSEVFDFLPFSTINKLIKSTLMPIFILSILNVSCKWFSNAKMASKKEVENVSPVLERDGDASDESDSGIENSENTKQQKRKSADMDVIDRTVKSNLESEGTKDVIVLFFNHLKIEPAIFYNIMQAFVFGVMAALVMRLKLLLVTQMCVVSSLLMNSSLYPLRKSYLRYLPVFWGLCLIPLAVNMYLSISEELSHIGEFSDLPQEQLMEWIRNATPSGAAFAGSMPVLATVMLATRRPIVAHPHYEHVEARYRAYKVYKTYGRFVTEELYHDLNDLKVSYLIVETSYCYGTSSKGCSFEEIWDIEKPWNSYLPLACRVLLTQRVEHFFPVFKNSHYSVFQIHDYSVQYMPRSFDT